VRIAITGSSGLIGSALAGSLEADGHSVVRVVRSGGGPGTTTWDPSAGSIDPSAFEGLDGVVHLAGEGIGARRWSGEQKRRILESRTKGTNLLSEALASCSDRPPVMVSGSAVGFYGDRGAEELTEHSGPGSGFLADVVQRWEASAGVAEAAGVRVPRLRTGIVLDRREGALSKMLPLFKVGLGGRFGSGEQWMSWISITDEVRVIRFLLEGDLAGPVNATAPEPVTNRELTKTLGEVLGRPSLLPVPAFGPKLLLGGELAESLLFDSQRVLPRALLEAGFEFRHPHIRTALRAVLDKER